MTDVVTSTPEDSADHNGAHLAPTGQTRSGMTADALRYLNQHGFYDQEFASDRNSIICGYELLMSHLILRRGWNISCLLPKYQGLDYRTLSVDPNPTSSGGDALFKDAYFGVSVLPSEGLFVKMRRGYANI